MSMRTAEARQWGRYLLAGGINTLATYALYLALLRVLPYGPAYVLSFMAGVLLSWVMLRFAVFRRAGKRGSVLWVAAAHAAQLLLGLALVRFWVEGLRGPAWLAPVFATAVCVPLVYAAQRWVFSAHDL